MSVKRDFWSRRRAAVEAEELAELQNAEAQATKAELAALEERDDSEILAELDLPDPDTLKLGDDVTGFMARAVPDRLRRRALRKLWTLNPVLANVDGLVDYGEDFTDSALVVENLQTAYQVGKGMLAHIEEMARQAEADAAPETEAAQETEAMAETDETEVLPADAAEMPALQPVAEATQAACPRSDQAWAPAETETETAETTAPAPRRMRFVFEG